MTLVTPPEPLPQNTATAAARPYVRRLERLVTTLLGIKIGGPNDLMRLQMDLLTLQRDIQKAIAAAKAERRTPAKAVELKGLRGALWEARRFGDTFAWLVLHRERQVIYPLAENPQRVGVPPDDAAWAGFESVVGYLGAQGLGFPLLHDLTDTLRIGDVTFIKPGEPPATAELKTQMLGSEPAEAGRRKVRYQVTAMWAGEDPPARVKAVTEGMAELPGDREPPPMRPRPKMKPSLGRQLQRLRKAERLRAAVDGQFIEHGDDKPSLTVVGPAYGGRSHWPVLRRLAREARRDGCATASVEDAILYVAIHRADGLEGADMHELIKRVPDDLQASGIFWDEGHPLRERNRMELFSIPEEPPDDNRAQL